ncbi:hypothetical protein KPATCC21470_0775 [Kitasatospora purpeofusca]
MVAAERRRRQSGVSPASRFRRDDLTADLPVRGRPCGALRPSRP